MPSLHLALDGGWERRMTMTQKEFTTPVKVKNLGDARRFGLRRHTPVGYTAAQISLLSLVDAWCSWRASSNQNNAGVDAMNG
ncbi:Calcium-transporting ATPase 3 [Fusarium oxysporum f. sp. albedinis]|nr:Calcium-transporting ATPase 3 [Fusarium oxysporum f. sp. albedinis]